MVASEDDTAAVTVLKASSLSPEGAIDVGKEIKR